MGLGRVAAQSDPRALQTIDRTPLRGLHHPLWIGDVAADRCAVFGKQAKYTMIRNGDSTTE
jgi:hypothetical protein